jgi:hypothetical protein
MKAPNLCDHRKCRRVAVAAYDVRPSFGRLGSVAGEEFHHYEVCAKHEAEFFPRGEGWVAKERSEAIKRELIPSDEERVPVDV